jgi:hypothetical protein
MFDYRLPKAVLQRTICFIAIIAIIITLMISTSLPAAAHQSTLQHRSQRVSFLTTTDAPYYYYAELYPQQGITGYLPAGVFNAQWSGTTLPWSFQVNPILAANLRYPIVQQYTILGVNGNATTFHDHHTERIDYLFHASLSRYTKISDAFWTKHTLHSGNTVDIYTDITFTTNTGTFGYIGYHARIRVW